MTAGGRIVVSGLGAVSPFGAGIECLWRGLEEGRTAIGAFDLFDASRHRTRLAGQVSVAQEGAAKRRSRSDRFACIASEEALRAARWSAPEMAVRTGLFFGSSTGGMLEGEQFFAELSAGGRRRAHASRVAAQPTSSPAEAVARAFGLRGPVETVAAACAASTMAIEAALLALRAGAVDCALAGGADALCQLTFGGFNSLRAVDEGPARPFRKDRAGLSLGEGAGVLFLEREESALRRGLAPAVELLGAASSCDAYHMTAPEPAGAGAVLAIERALADAGLAPEAIDFVNVHGTGTPHNDAAEWQALQRVFGARASELPLSATKGAVGHLLGACGGLEAVVTALCLGAARLPPTPGGGETDPERVALVLERARALPRAATALSLNLAFGGANAALVLRALAPRGEGARA